MRVQFRKHNGVIVTVVLVGTLILLCWRFSFTRHRYPYKDPLVPTDDTLCVLIPYRDRYNQLLQLIPKLDAFLNRQDVKHHFIVLNQTDSYRFNRASLINVGWFEADRLRCNYIVMHDVDLIPLNPALNYRFPGVGVVRHIASGQYHPKERYDYPKFIGGILLLTLEDFKIVNGMSNKYWGWGLEDDEFYLRLRDANLTAYLERPRGLTTGRSDTFSHIHNDKEYRRDYYYTPLQKKMSHQRDRVSGLFTVRYHVADRNLLHIDNAVVSVVDVKLHCDLKWTPFCVSQ